MFLTIHNRLATSAGGYTSQRTVAEGALRRAGVLRDNPHDFWRLQLWIHGLLALVLRGHPKKNVAELATSPAATGNH